MLNNITNKKPSTPHNVRITTKSEARGPNAERVTADSKRNAVKRSKGLTLSEQGRAPFHGRQPDDNEKHAKAKTALIISIY